MKSIKSYFFVASIILVSFFYIFDLGNLDALRQGTEGFYLQISKEMSEKGSFLTPYYRDVRHWSKPPLHFVFPFPFYALDIFSLIFSARLSIALLTILSLLLTAKWIRKHFNIELHTSFLFFAASVGMLKYGRIYMMEIPLSLLTFVGCIYFYDYYKSRNIKDLIIPSFMIGGSILIKGPVSYVLAMASIGTYFLFDTYKTKKINIKPVILVATISLLLGSIWFIVSYINYGKEFFDYFFLRENMGKFTAKSYPVRHVLQGLIIFALPWSLYLPYSYLNFRDYFKSSTGLESEKKNIIIYLLIHFALFLVVWLIPSQRSHHYAMPAMPFFLTLLLISLVKSSNNTKRASFLKFSNIMVSIGAFIILAVFSVATYFIDTISPDKDLSFFMISTLIILAGSIVMFIRSNNITFKSIGSLVFIGWIWTVVSPKFVPALIPAKVVEQSKDKKVYAHVRKPYFVEEALNKKVSLLDMNKINELSLTTNDVLIMSYSDFINYFKQDEFKVLHRWSIWRRRTKTREIINALTQDNIESIRQHYVLLQPKDNTLD